MSCPFFDIVVFQCLVDDMDGKELATLALTCKRFLGLARKQKAYIRHYVRVEPYFKPIVAPFKRNARFKIGWDATTKKNVCRQWLQRVIPVELQRYYNAKFFVDFFACDQWKFIQHWIDTSQGDDDVYVALLRFAPKHKTTSTHACTKVDMWQRLQNVQHLCGGSGTFTWRTVYYKQTMQHDNDLNSLHSAFYVIGNTILVDGTYIQLMLRTPSSSNTKKQKLTHDS